VKIVVHGIGILKEGKGKWERYWKGASQCQVVGFLFE